MAKLAWRLSSAESEAGRILVSQLRIASRIWSSAAHRVVFFFEVLVVVSRRRAVAQHGLPDARGVVDTA